MRVESRGPNIESREKPRSIDSILTYYNDVNCTWVQVFYEVISLFVTLPPLESGIMKVTFVNSINVLDSCICYCCCITSWPKFLCIGIHIDLSLSLSVSLSLSLSLSFSLEHHNEVLTGKIVELVKPETLSQLAFELLSQLHSQI